MLKTMKNKKATAWGGLGIALFLCVLMALMPLAGVVENTSDEKTDLVEENNSSADDVFALPDQYRPVAYDAFDPAQEQKGMRSLYSKAYMDDEGQTRVVTTADPMHYLEDGVWKEIDLNVVSTADGWEVKKNLIEVEFADDLNLGVSVDLANDGVDPIVTGINPKVTMLDETGKEIMDYKFAAAESDVSIGGNTLRYHMLDGFDLDYSVRENLVKQDLVIRERPNAEVLGDAAWFGLTEEMILPLGYALYLEGDMIGFDQLVKTQSPLSIRNIQTGEELAFLPEPIVTQAPNVPSADGEPVISQEDYLATYFVRYVDGVLVISTMVEVDWLLSDERVFPVSIDPSLSTSANNHGYCRTYSTSPYCGKRNSASSYTRWRMSGTSQYSRYVPFIAFDLPTIPSTATVSQMSLSVKMRYWYYGGGYQNQPVDTVIMQDCGSATTSLIGTTPSCNTDLVDPSWGSSSYTYGGCGDIPGGNYDCPRSGYGSDTVASHNWVSLGTGGTVVTGNVCSSITSCATGVAGSMQAAYLAGDTVGAGFHVDVTKSGSYSGMEVRQSYGGSYVSPSLTVLYSAGADTAAPEMITSAYDGVTSYVEGQRTMFATFSDDTGVDTSPGNAPTLKYSINGVAESDVEGTVIGSCTSQACHVKAQTVAFAAGDDVVYNWTMQDTNATPNSAVTANFDFSVASVMTAPATDRKVQILTEGVNSDDGYSHSTFYNRQLTYWEGSSNEYLHEWDTSNCGTGSSACFDTAAGGSGTYAAPQWRVMWQTNPNSAPTYTWGATSENIEYHKGDGGFLDIDETDGPNMNLLHWYDTTADTWVMVGIGDGSTDISDELGAGLVLPIEQTVYRTMSHLVPVPTTFTSASFGEFALEQTGSTYQTTKANWICVNSHGWTYFFRSTSSTPNCEAGYSDTTRKWSGFSLGMREDQDSASTYQTSYAESKVKPEPDTFAPTLDHSPMTDSHSKSRTFKFTITENGNPATGLDIGASAGNQPTLYYQVTAPGVSAGSTFTQILLTPEGGNPANCVVSTCDWTYTLDNLERGHTVTYYASARDISAVGGTSSNGANIVTTPTINFEVGDPNMVFIVEWHDMGVTRTVSCSFQALFYDVTNEIEFHYDDDCEGYLSGGNPYAYYNKAISGYQDDTRTHGATMRDSTTAWDGANPHANNFRISTGANGANAWETFETGMEELVDYDEQLTGTSNGNPSSFYCSYAYYWSSNSAGCNVNMDMPDNFYFDYFGTEYNGSDNDSRVHISRLGNMYFRADGIQALELSYDYSWGNSMVTMPNAGNAYSKAGNIAPYWHRYVSNYCYDDANNDCSIRTRLLPFEGKGTDVTETQYGPMNFTMIDSPIRIDPSVGDYLSFQGGMTVEPGVVFQVAEGKGISIDGACTTAKFEGNDSANGTITFEGDGDKTWLGIAFTGHCSTTGGTDSRHVMSYVDIKNTSMAAISGGSRHGNHAAGQPFTDSNVGNFSMDHISFDNVASAFSHGSGDGTVIEMSDYTISNAKDSCLDFAKDSVVTLTSGTMTNCNINDVASQGAITVDSGSSKGSLTVDYLNVTNSYQNLINVDLSAVWIENVNAVLSTGFASETGSAVSSVGRGVSGDAFWCGLYGSCTKIVNLTVTGGSYVDGVTVSSKTSYHLEDISLESGEVLYDYAGIGAVPTKYSAFITDITADAVRLQGGSVPSTMTTLTVEDIVFTGDAVSTNTLQGSDWMATGEIKVGDSTTGSACGWNIELATFTASRMHLTCSDSNNKNRVRVSDGVVSHNSTDSFTTSAFYARNTELTIGETAVTSPNIGGLYFGAINTVAFASSNSDIRLISVALTIDADQDGALDAPSQCTIPADCEVFFVSSADLWFGSLATVVVTKEQPTGTGNFVTKADHFVQANYVDAASGLESFAIGLTKSDAAGVASNVWVITADETGAPITLNAVHVWGAGGVNDTVPSDPWYPGCTDTNSDGVCDVGSPAAFAAGNTLTVVLEPQPVSLNGTDMTCADLGSHEVAGLAGDGADSTAYDAGETFTFEAKVTMETNVTLDGCNIIIKNQWKIAGSSAFVPILTIGAGSTFTAAETGGVKGNLMSATTLYPGLVVLQGTLVLDNAKMTNIGYGASGAAIDLGAGASMTVKSGSTIIGAATSSTASSIIQIGKDSIFDFDDSVITANGGTALKFNEKALQADVDNAVISNAEIGIHSINAEPQVSEYTLTNNDVGMVVVNNPPPPPPPPLCVLGGPGVYYGGWRGPLSCTVTLPAGQTLDIKLEQYGWGGETSVSVTGPSSYSVGPYYFASYTTYDPLVSFTVAGTYTIVLDDTWGDGGARMTAALASDDGGVEDPEVCDLGGTAYNPSFSVQQCTFTLDPNRAFDVTLQTYSWAGEASVQIEVSNDGGSTWSDEYYGGTYSYSNYQFYDLGSFSNAGDYRITLGDSWGDGGQQLVATMQPAGSMIAAFDNGTITGSDDVAIRFGGTAGEATVGSIDYVDITSPAGSTAFDVAGWTNEVTVNGLNVTGGDYGIDTGVVSSGSITFTNIDISGTLHAAVFYANDMDAAVSGIIGSNTGAAIKFGQYTSADVDFSGLSLTNNGIGLEAQGSGAITVIDSAFANTVDVLISGTSNVVVVDGTVATTDVSTQIEVTGSGLFERARGFEYTLTADSGSGAVAQGEVNVVMLDGDSDVASMAETDATTGLADLLFNIYTKDSNGQTDMDLAGYTVAGVAEVQYDTTVGDFRYVNDSSLGLSDTSVGNEKTYELVDNIDYRVCSTSTTSYESNVVDCNNWGWNTYERTLLQRDGGSDVITEFDWNNGIGYGAGSNAADWSDSTVMFDAYRIFMDDNTVLDLSGSEVFVTGGYNFYAYRTQLFTASYPYSAGIILDDTTVTAMATDSIGRLGWELGQAHVVDIDIHNSILNGIGGIVAVSYPPAYSNDPHPSFSVTDSTLVHFEPNNDITGSTSFYTSDSCLYIGAPNAVITGNDLIGCPAGVMIANTYSNYAGANGADGSSIENNTFTDTGGLDIWFTYTSDADDVVVRSNNFTGSQESMYGVYAQSFRSTGMIIDDNDFWSAKEAIYMRGALGWEITNNNIYGNGDASYAGIYELDGFGEISGNTLIDADGGILVDGVTLPPPSKDMRCSIGQFSYSTFASCTAQIVAGETLSIRLKTDSWSGSEGSLQITKPDGTIDSWPQYTLPRNQDQDPLTTYDSSADASLVGTYTIEVSDSWGDGGQQVDAYVSLGGAGGGLVITDNTIKTSINPDGSVRTAPSAVGIWLESCVGSALVSSARNNITLLQNTLVTDGCDITDVDSTFNAAGGTAGTVYTVDVNSDNFGPQNLSIQEGDSVRWRAIAYYNGAAHDITSNGTGPAGAWGTVNPMNLGSTYVNTFTAAGTEDYHCSIHPDLMWGSITVNANTGNTLSSTGINILGAVDDVVLDGTNVGGFGYGIEVNGGSLHLTGDAIISGDDNAVKANDATITSDGASLFAGATSGTALLAEGTTSVELVDLSVSGFRGLDTDNAFTWNGGSSTAATTLYTAADGKIENMTWGVGTVMIHAKDYARILSVANNLVASQLVIGPDAVINEGNLFNLNVTHESTAVDATETLGLVIQSTDDSRAEYASVAYRGSPMYPNGDMGDWFGSYPLAPFDDAAPGLMSGTEAEGLFITYDPNNIYIAVTGVDFDTAGDLQIYFDSRTTGASQSSTGVASPLAHNLPFKADYAFIASDNSNYEMKLHHPLLGWNTQASCTGVDAEIGSGVNTNTEISIPMSCLDPDNSELRILALVQGSSAVTSVYPDQTIANDGSAEEFVSSISIINEDEDLNTGTAIRNHVLIYQSYLGSNVDVNGVPVASESKQYDVRVKSSRSTCDQNAGLQVLDWGEETGISLDIPNVYAEIDILPACPDFSSLVNLTFDEDSVVSTIDLATMAEDAQDASSSLAWTVTAVSVDQTPAQLLSHNLLGNLLDITLHPDQHSESSNGGAYHLEFAVTDSDGLMVKKTIKFDVNDVNDKPIIGTDCTDTDSDGVCDTYAPPVFDSITSFDADNNTIVFENFALEGDGDFTYLLGENATNGSRTSIGGLKGLIYDMGQKTNPTMAYEMDEIYSWQVDVDAGCPVFSASINSFANLVVVESITNEAGGYCDITLNLTDGTDYADEVTITYGVVPVNDAPEVLNWDPANGVVIYDGNGAINSPDDNAGAAPWKITLTEDDESTENLTFNLSAMKSDVDHIPEDTYWQVSSTGVCEYEDYFTIEINNDELVIDLIKDAQTTDKGEKDYFQDADGDGIPDGGIHQSDIGFCPITVTLFDSAVAPSYYPNYDTTIMPPSNYKQLSATKSLEIRVENVPELVPDYYFDEAKGFDFHQVNYIIPKSYVPTTVTIGAQGDAGEYNYKHMLEVCMTSNGHQESKSCDTLVPPEYGETIEYTKDVYITRGTTSVSVEMDVLTCASRDANGSFCDTNLGSKDRFWSYSYPQAHRCVNNGALDAAFSCPGLAASDVTEAEDGTASLTPLNNFRTPMLEDQLWCNNKMSSNVIAESCGQKDPIPVPDLFLASGDPLPEVVDLIASASVPSFAPGIIVISAAGMFVSALVLSSRREDDEAELEETLVDDEGAVSPVIATILMVAITVVLSGVIYVWASSLADTSGGKGVPRFTFELHSDKALDITDAHYGFSVISSEQDLATQSMVVTVFYTNETGGTSIVDYSLASPTVYGYGPENSNSLVTFGDAPETDTENIISTYNTGDYFYVRTVTEDGYDFSGDDFQVQLSYVPGGAGDQGAVLRVWEL